MEQVINKTQFVRLTEEAGFTRFSPDEDPQTPIDWSCDYTQELQRLTELVIRECIGVVDTAVTHREPASTYTAKIKQHFGGGSES